MEAPGPVSRLQVAPQYADFATWQRDRLEPELLQKQLSFWVQQLSEGPQLQLPTDRARGTASCSVSKSVNWTLSRALTAQLLDLAQHEGVTAFVLMLSTVASLLTRLSGQSEIVIGTLVTDREHADLQPLIGPFENALALRADVREDPPFRQLLRRMTAVTHAANQHRQVPFLHVLEALECGQPTGYHPVFQVMFTMEVQRPASSPEATRATAVAMRTSVPLAGKTAPLDLSIILRKDDGRFVCTLEYASELFERDTILRFANHWQMLLEGIVADPECPVSRLPLMTAEDRRQILQPARHSESTVTYDQLIHEVFERQAARTPEALAVVYESCSLTYGELNQRANQLSRHLRENGIGPKQLVALCVERSLELVIGILGILKTGAAYVPLEPAYPTDRMAHLLSDCAPAALVIQTRRMSHLPLHTLKTVAIEEDWEEIARQPCEDMNARVLGISPHDLAYVIYTSGSTGTPKGVMVEHRNVIRLFAATQPWFEFNERDVWTLFHSFAFDFSVWELWGALLYGGRLVVVPRGLTRSPQDFYVLLCETGVTVLNQTPSAFAQLIGAQNEGRHCLRVVIFGGEALEPRMLRPWVQRNGMDRPRLVNMYGITETTVHVTYCPVTREHIELDRGSPIGGPIPDLRVYLLDRHREPVPFGVVGEMYIGGAGVARGYLNRPELTRERFIPDPFSDNPGDRLYKSGDLARWRKDGSIEYLGRSDHQVKIRGFRIELGEIEGHLARHDLVKEAVVIAREDTPGEKQLTAYVIPKTSGGTRELTPEILRAHLHALLPEYMIPGAFMTLEAFPLTSNGKLDRRALPAPTVQAYATVAYQPPQGDSEQALSEIWQATLRVPRVGRSDNFFALGGHSLSALKTIAAIAEMFSVQLPVTALYRHVTIEDLAKHLRAIKLEGAEPLTRQISAAEVPILPRAPGCLVPCHPFQMLLWNDLEQRSFSTRSCVTAVRIVGPLDTGVLRQSLALLVDRHEALRTTFVYLNGNLRQHVKAADSPELQIIDLNLRCADSELELTSVLEEFAGEKVDVFTGPLFKTLLVRLATSTHILVMALDHLIADGACLEVLNRELWRLYECAALGLPPTLPAARIQFGDYLVWEHETRDDWLVKHDEYWRQRLSGAPRAQLPLRAASAESAGSSGAILDCPFGDDLTAKLRELSRHERRLPALVVLTVYVSAMFHWCDQRDLIVPFVDHGRDRPELDNLVGHLSRWLPLRIEVLAADTYRDLLWRVCEEFYTAYDHRDFTRSSVLPMFMAQHAGGLHFNWLPAYCANWSVCEARSALTLAIQQFPQPFPVRGVVPPFSFTPFFFDGAAGLGTSVAYRPDLVPIETVRQFNQLIRTVAAEFTQDPQARIGARKSPSEPRA